MSEYSQKFKDPRWQKKRLEILDRDKWTCQSCGDKESTLHVHHCFYRHREPWEYPDKSLVTLCAKCHIKEQESINAAGDWLLLLVKQAGLLSEDIWDLANTLQGYTLPFGHIKTSRVFLKKIREIFKLSNK